MNTMLDNFINGNIATAKAQAKRYSLKKISDALQESYGYSLHKSIMTAYFLKGQCTFQEACDAV